MEPTAQAVGIEDNSRWEPRRGEKNVAHGASRGYRTDARREPRRGERVHQSQRYFSFTVIPFFFKNAMNSSWNDLAL